MNFRSDDSLDAEGLTEVQLEESIVILMRE